MKAETIQQKNVCQPNLSLQKLDTSSIAKRSPPTGAPNAALTPAPAPAVRKFLLAITTNVISLFCIGTVMVPRNQQYSGLYRNSHLPTFHGLNQEKLVRKSDTVIYTTSLQYIQYNSHPNSYVYCSSKSHFRAC